MVGDGGVLFWPFYGIPPGKGLEVTIKLLPDLKWGDGQPVTANDVAFTVHVAQDPGAGFSNINAWSRADSARVMDDRTVVLHLPRAIASYAQWDQILPEHIGPIYARAHTAGDYINTTEYNHNPTNPGLWDGPYLITKYDVGSQVVLEPNPNWPGIPATDHRKAGFKHIVLRFFGDTAALEANLLSGDIDVDSWLTLDQASALKSREPDRFDYLTFPPSRTYTHIDVQKDNPVLQDVRVRRALLMSIDRQTINAKLFGGMDLVPNSFVSPRDEHYDADIPAVPFDPAGARKLLAEAGWTPGPDGVCRNAAGDRLSFELLTTAGVRYRELKMAVIQSGWRQIGVDVNLRFEPSRTMFGTTAKHRSYSGLMLYNWTDHLGVSPRRTLGTDQIPTAENNWSGANYAAFSNKQFDADIATVETDLDPAHQMAAYADMQRIYAEQLPALPLFIDAGLLALPQWLDVSGTGQLAPEQAEAWRSNSQP